MSNDTRTAAETDANYAARLQRVCAAVDGLTPAELIELGAALDAAIRSEQAKAFGQ